MAEGESCKTAWAREYLAGFWRELQVVQDVFHQQGSQHGNLVPVKQLEGSVLLCEVHQAVSISIQTSTPTLTQARPTLLTVTILLCLQLMSKLAV